MNEFRPALLEGIEESNYVDIHERDFGKVQDRMEPTAWHLCLNTKDVTRLDPAAEPENHHIPVCSLFHLEHLDASGFSLR